MTRKFYTPIDMTTLNKVVNLAEPTVAQDAATKSYVDLRGLPPQRLASGVPLGAYGDECDTITPDAAWSLRNIASVTGDGSRYTFLADAAGDAVHRSYADPSGVTCTASSEYNASYAATKAFDGSTSTEWAAVGNTVGMWWMVTFVTPRTISQVTLLSRSTGSLFGSGHLEFSSGANVAFTALVSGVVKTIDFSSRTTSFVKVVNEAGAEGNAGLKEVTTDSAVVASVDLALMAHIVGLTSLYAMVGICALDENGAGMALTTYGSDTRLITVGAWLYTGAPVALAVAPTVGDHWLHMRRTAGIWYGRVSSDDGRTWSAWTSGWSDGNRNISRIGVLRAYTSGGSQTPSLERFVYGTPSIEFTPAEEGDTLRVQGGLPTWTSLHGRIEMEFNGHGLPPAIGIKTDFVVPHDMLITNWTMLADVEGSIEVDLWKSNLDDYPPTVAGSVTGTDKPRLSSQVKASSSALTGWTKTWLAGECIRVNLDSALHLSRASAILEFDRLN